MTAASAPSPGPWSRRARPDWRKVALATASVAINAGLKSRTQAISERGYDAEQVDAETAADKARSDALGLSFEARPATKEDIPDE